jgi:exopolysaccharide biosynthesis predicted pyruvyltransferase EpsI
MSENHANMTPGQIAQQVLSTCIDPSIPVALLDYPDHTNVGDCAIWAGEVKYLSQAQCDVRYVCDVNNFNEAAMRSRVPFGQILLHGGGNFGTVWPLYQAFREMVVQRFPEYRIVQLPQSIHFKDEQSLARARQNLSRHTDFTLLVRDRESLKVATEDLGVKAQLCPDSALMLAGSLVRTAAKTDVLVLARSDKEMKGAGLAGFTVPGAQCKVVDWLDEPPSWRHTTTQWVKAGARSALGGGSYYQRVQKKLFSELANERIARGVAILNQGRIVVTDRLHSHILCTLLGIQHVVLDNEYGKLSRFIDCWHPNHPLFDVVQDAQGAQAAARRRLDAMAASGQAG